MAVMHAIDDDIMESEQRFLSVRTSFYATMLQKCQHCACALPRPLAAVMVFSLVTRFPLLNHWLL